MKQLFCQLLILLLIFFTEDSYSGNTGGSAWGYIVHTDNLSRPYLLNIMNRFSVICITGFSLEDNGTIRMSAASSIDTIRELTSKKGVTLYPLISFKSARSGRRILSDEHTRKKAARSIAAMSDRLGFPGVHLDFEFLPPEYAKLLGLLLDDLRKDYSGKITMAVFPKIGFPSAWSGFHDMAVIAPRVDAVVMMCYDLNGSHTGPGPVTDVKWAEKNIKYALKHIKPGRLWLGIPAYGYRWCGNKATALSSKHGVKLPEKHNARRDPSGNLFYKSGNSCLTYISDSHTRSLLRELAGRYGLAGTAVWRIGFEE